MPDDEIKKLELNDLKGSTPSDSIKLVNPDSLEQQDRRTLDRYLNFSSQKGVVTNVFKGSDNWDLRPLLFHENKLFIVRFSDPLLSLNPDRFAAFKSFLHVISSSATKDLQFAWGLSGEQLWYRRRFFKVILAALSSPQDPALEEHPLRFCKSILRDYKRYFEKGIYHGNLSSTNVAVDGGRAVLLDWGMKVLGTAKKESDILSLGKLLRFMLGSDLDGQANTLINAIVDPDPSSRPSMTDLFTYFLPDEQQGSGSFKESDKVETGTDKGGLKSGRIIASDLKINPSETSPESSFPSGQLIKADLGQQKKIDTNSETKTQPQKSESSQKESIKQPIVLDKVIKEAMPVTPRSKNRPFIPGVIVLFFLSGIYLFYQYQDVFFNSVGPGLPYHQYWHSEQAELMQTVARAALNERDFRARKVIIDSAFNDRGPARINSPLIRVAFDPRWGTRLSEKERQLVLSLALSKVLATNPQLSINLKELHPGVLYALVATLPLGSSEDLFKGVPAAPLASLPDPEGRAFKHLYQLGAKFLNDEVLRALAHIMSGDFSRRVATVFLPDGVSKNILRGRLVILADLLAAKQSYEKQLISSLAYQGTALYRPLSWFNEDTGADWQDLSGKQRILILLGELNALDLSFEQLADLLSFSWPEVRKAALVRLVKANPREGFAATVSLLAGEGNRLKRLQTIALLSALRLERGAADAFIAEWFKTEPDPITVVDLLLVRRTVSKGDPFNLSAARYLARETWQVSVAKLEALMRHPELLARALAYARLDVSDPVQAELLRSMLAIEPNERIKERMLDKLALVSEGE